MRNRRTQANAALLRKQMTDAEHRLWHHLRKRQLNGYKFRRQYAVGPFIADFACINAGLIVEVDGGQHGEQRAKDEARTRFLESRGFRVLRFWNNDVLKQTDVCLEVIVRALGPIPTLPRKRGRETILKSLVAAFSPGMCDSAYVRIQSAWDWIRPL